MVAIENILCLTVDTMNEVAIISQLFCSVMTC